MELLLIGLLVVGIATGFLMSDMERKRRTLSELVERLEPMVPRNRRLALHNLHRLSQSLFYAQNLMAQIERELGLLEKEKEIARRGRVEVLLTHLDAADGNVPSPGGVGRGSGH